MLHFKGVEIKVAGRKLFGIDELKLSAGVVALVGRNGSGKSTFIRTVLGMHDAYTGTIFIKNEEQAVVTPQQRSGLVAVVFSKGTTFGSVKVSDLMGLGRLPYLNVFAKQRKEDQEFLQHIAEQLNITDLLDRDYNTLSDGQKQLIMIGRALVQDTPIILMDEPAAFLDMVNQYKVMQVLRTIASQSNKLILFSTHSFSFLDRVCDEVLLISEENLNVLPKSESFEATLLNHFGISE